ncbi:hypothetical protein CNMCM5793_000107 [Aspergillus hiratsukae]|uniref:Uncharacterized protein n=1 Tax=Aspergillus hiratsukae TaxID=1194566 RepID=A0A8H6P9P6_9EURO|nr:hypothetical protein CNMCM5793_000107 [Aspergillus hiratsukae]KAF7161004.1 hypothetical protein CNMCM6106_008342 [Aspergillus hiratsukae]
MEQNSQKRTRRSSITQQLHRIFNVDRQENRVCNGRPRSVKTFKSLTVDTLKQKQRESPHVPPNASARAAPDQHWQHKQKGSDSHHAMKGSPDLGDLDSARASGAASGEPLLRPSDQKSSTGLENAEEKVRGSSGKPEDTVRSIERYTALNGTNSVSQKKEKRVTRRLEAERIELEKRLLKLEQTQLAGNHRTLKRESRRLIKKQPLGSSSRGSSVSADESRPSSRRLSALFSISRRTSISRSSSVNGRNGEESTDSAPVPTKIPADDLSTPRVARPSLSTSLPERFSAVISKGLIVGSNALLEDQTPPAQSPSSPATATVTNDPERLEANEECSLQKSEPTLDHAKQQIDDYGRSSKPRSLHTSPDLDRISFAATLHLARRAGDSDQLQGRSPGTVQRPSLVQRDITQNGKLYDSQSPGSSKIRAVSKPTPSSIDNPSSLPAKVSVKSMPRRTFKPSPLAGGSTSGESSQSLADNASASRWRNSGGSNGARRTPSSPLVTVATGMSPAVGSLQFLQPSTNSQSENEKEGKALDAASERTSKSNNSANTRVLKEQESLDYFSSQQSRSRHLDQSSGPVSNPSQLSVRSRIDSSTSDKNINHPSQKLLRQEEAPAVHGPRTVRVDQDIPHLPEHKSPRRLDAQQSTTPGSASSRSSSPETCSEDYDTADETGSIDDDRLHGKSAAASGAGFVQDIVESTDSTRASKFSNSAVSKVGDPKSDKSATATGACQKNQSIAKTFVICCSCKCWHDMPPESYSKVASPGTCPVPATNGSTLLGRSSSVAGRNPSRTLTRRTQIKSALLNKRSANEKVTLGSQTRSQVADTPLRCCWCNHPMSRRCCEGWTTTVYKHEKQF